MAEYQQAVDAVKWFATDTLAWKFKIEQHGRQRDEMERGLRHIRDTRVGEPHYTPTKQKWGVSYLRLTEASRLSDSSTLADSS